jgi:hypothetical protein
MSIIIPDSAVSDWKDLQIRVRDFFREMRYEAEAEHRIDTARGKVEVDVWIRDPNASVNTIYLAECKHWKKRVTPEVARAFRTTMADFGASTGFIVSRVGFSSGVDDVVQYTNIHPLTWEQLQRAYGNEWLRKKRSRIEELRSSNLEVRNHFHPDLAGLQQEVLNAVIHTPELNQEFCRLRKLFGPLEVAATQMYIIRFDESPLDIPYLLKSTIFQDYDSAVSVRQYFDRVEAVLNKWFLDFHTLMF